MFIGLNLVNFFAQIFCSDFYPFLNFCFEKRQHFLFSLILYFTYQFNCPINLFFLIFVLFNLLLHFYCPVSCFSLPSFMFFLFFSTFFFFFSNSFSCSLGYYLCTNNVSYRLTLSSFLVSPSRFLHFDYSSAREMREAPFRARGVTLAETVEKYVPLSLSLNISHSLSLTHSLSHFHTISHSFSLISE